MTGKESDKRYYAKHREECRAYGKKYYAGHREKILASRNRYNVEHREDARARSKKHSKLRYGLSPGDYDRLFAEQGGRCAICGKHQTEFKKRLFIDHDHETGVVRGLLCIKCNGMLGYAKDNMGILLNAVEYLERADEESGKT